MKTLFLIGWDGGARATRDFPNRFLLQRICVSVKKPVKVVGSIALPDDIQPLLKRTPTMIDNRVSVEYQQLRAFVFTGLALGEAGYGAQDAPAVDMEVIADVEAGWQRALQPMDAYRGVVCSLLLSGALRSLKYGTGLYLDKDECAEEVFLRAAEHGCRIAQNVSPILV